MVIVQVEKNDNYAKIKNLHNKKIRQKKSVIPLVVGPRYIFYAHSLCPEAVLRCANDDTPRVAIWPYARPNKSNLAFFDCSWP